MTKGDISEKQVLISVMCRLCRLSMHAFCLIVRILRAVVQPCATKNAASIMLYVTFFADLASKFTTANTTSCDMWLIFSLTNVFLLEKRSAALLAFPGTCFSIVWCLTGALSFREICLCFVCPPRYCRRSSSAVTVRLSTRRLAYQGNCSSTFSRRTSAATARRRRQVPLFCREIYSGFFCRRRLPPPTALRTSCPWCCGTVRLFLVCRGSCFGTRSPSSMRLASRETCCGFSWVHRKDSVVPGDRRLPPLPDTVEVRRRHTPDTRRRLRPVFPPSGKPRSSPSRLPCWRPRTTVTSSPVFVEHLLPQPDVTDAWTGWQQGAGLEANDTACRPSFVLPEQAAQMNKLSNKTTYTGF